MNVKVTKAARKLVSAMNSEKRSETSPYDTRGEVRRVDGDTAFVKFVGGEGETPVKMTISCQPGDTVQVRVANKTAWITGNLKRPPTDDTKADHAIGQAADAVGKSNKALDNSDKAIETADQAKKEAVTATNYAEQAEQAANDAQSYARAANEASEAASSYAEAALGSANNAFNYASSAFNQLSEVEKVMDVLNWASEHGKYVITADTEVEEGKWYFDGTFALTTDTALNSTKTYYTYSSGVYTAVDEPDVLYIGTYYEGIFDVVANPSSPAGYYELSGVDAAISNYVMSHMALTNDGLFIQLDNSSTRLQVASNGVYLWTPSGRIAQYTDKIILGIENDIHVTVSPINGLGFYQGQEDPDDPSVNRVAYISANKLYISSAEITQELRVGNFVFKPRSGRFTLQYSPQ